MSTLAQTSRAECHRNIQLSQSLVPCHFCPLHHLYQSQNLRYNRYILLSPSLLVSQLSSVQRHAELRQLLDGAANEGKFQRLGLTVKGSITMQATCKHSEV